MIAPVALPLVPLDALHADEAGVVVELDGPAVAINRLQELGLRIGERIRMVRPGPPHLLQLGQTRLALRSDPDVLVLIGIGEG